MSTSDTSSEENFDMLREAADGQFINDSMFTSNRTDSGTHKGKLIFVSRQLYGLTDYLNSQSILQRVILVSYGNEYSITWPILVALVECFKFTCTSIWMHRVECKWEVFGTLLQLLLIR